jgi:hypothetical protein
VPEVHDFVPVYEDFEEAGSVLVSDGGAWLTDAATDALSESEHVAVEFGDARMIERSVVVPVRWSMDEGPFKTLDADLRLEPMPTHHSHLSFSGSYEVAPNGNDQITDRHLIESAVRRFMIEVAAVLERGGDGTS